MGIVAVFLTPKSLLLRGIFQESTYFGGIWRTTTEEQEHRRKINQVYSRS